MLYLKFESRPVFFLFLTTVFFALVVSYFPAMTAPFYLDDQVSIIDNGSIRSLDFLAIHHAFPGREVGYLTFALNYLVSGLDVASFRITNIIIHVFVASTLSWFVYVVLNQFDLRRPIATKISVVAGSLFLLSAFNSQPVIYIVQRVALLSALFFILTLVCYIKFRVQTKANKYMWLALTCIFFFLGGHTKQNFLVLPLVLLVIEWFWFASSRTNLLVKSLFLVLLCVGITGHFLDFYLQLGVVDSIDSATRETYRLTRWEYFTHQLSAVFMYQWKFLVPYPLLLEYSSRPTTWESGLTWIALLFHSVLLLTAFKYRSKHPLFCALIIIYYITHLVESSINPISDLTVEHRAYLPNLFMSFLLALIWYKLFEYKRYIAIPLILALLILNSVVLHARSLEWASKDTFYKKELRYTGDNSRIYAEIANLFTEKRQLRVAQRWLKSAIIIGLDTKHLQGRTVVKYIQLLVVNNKIALATRFAALGLDVITIPEDRALIYYEIAKVKAIQGLCDVSITYVNKAREAHDGNYEVLECEPSLIKYVD